MHLYHEVHTCSWILFIGVNLRVATSQTLTRTGGSGVKPVLRFIPPGIYLVFMNIFIHTANSPASVQNNQAVMP